MNTASVNTWSSFQVKFKVVSIDTRLSASINMSHERAIDTNSVARVATKTAIDTDFRLWK